MNVTNLNELIQDLG